MGEEVKQRDVQGIVFDPANFMRSILSNTNRARSDMGSMPGKVVESTGDEPMGELVESRLNAFYRMIGLPATRNDSIRFLRTKSNLETTDTQLSQNNTLNYFSPGLISVKNSNGEYIDGNKASNLISGRESALQKSVDPEKMVEMVIKPISLDASVKPNQSRRTSLFPMLVDASTPIYPLKKRTAPLFNDGDFILSGASNTRLPRPFIESVIYMRTKVYSGAIYEKLKIDLASNIRTFVKGNTQPLSSEEEALTSKELIESLGLGTDNSIENFNLLELELINKLIQAIRKSSMNYRATLNRATELKKQVMFIPEYKENPAEISGNSKKSIEGIVAGSVDKIIYSLENQLAELSSFINLLPTNEVKRADTSYRSEGDEVVRNVLPDAFISDFTSLITFDRGHIQSQLAEAKVKRAKILSEYNLLKEGIQYFTGEHTGLSIFDILCVFLALFTILVESLVLLLNKDARERLLNSSFYSFQNDTDNEGVLKETSSSSGARN